MSTLNKTNDSVLLIPVIGISLFFVLYLVAATLYPGGSDQDRISTGFSFVDNYWCDLMEYRAKNGTINPGQPFAQIGWVVLCLSIGFFWFYLPGLFASVNIKHSIIRYSGLLSTVIGFFLITKHHDSVVKTAAFFGAIALATLVLELKEARFKVLFGLGVLCFMLGLINYIIFTTNFLISKLPVLQKLAFATCLLTFGWIDLKIYLKSRLSFSSLIHVGAFWFLVDG